MNIPPSCKRSTRFWYAAVISVFALAGSSVRAQVNITNGLVAYWNFDKSDFTDSVGKFDGTANGTTPITFTAGKPGFGQAMVLDDTANQFVEITGRDATYDPDQLAFQGGSVTIAGWFTVTSFDKSWQALIAKGEGTNWRVHRNGGNPTMAYAGGIGEGPNDGPDITDGNWHHFAAVTDQNATDFGTCIYIDGVRTSVNSGTPNLNANAKNVKIGDNPDATGRYWNGKVDDLAIWNRVLSQDEVNALYNNGTGKAVSSFFGAPPPPGPLSVAALVPAAGATKASLTNVVSITFLDGTTTLKTNSVTMKLDNTNVTTTASSPQAGLKTFTYVPSGVYLPLSVHTVSVSYSDNSGGNFSTNWSFTVQSYVYLDASWALSAADATAAKANPGFFVELWGLDLPSQSFPNNNNASEQALAGEWTDDVGDFTSGGYTDNSTLITKIFGIPLRDEPGQIDWASGSLPGVPTLASQYASAGTDNFVYSFFTALEFDTPGIYTLDVNSDDGFRTYASTNQLDRYQLGAEIVGEFSGGRGTADTDYKFYVAQPGLYPFRTTYEEGGGGYAVHWYQRNPDKSTTPVNGTGAVKAFRWISQQRAFIGRLSPGDGQGGIASTSVVSVVIGDGALTKYVTGSAKMSLDNTDVTSKLKISASGGLTTVVYDPGGMAKGSQHTVTVSYSESSTPVSSRTNTYTFRVANAQPSDLPANSFWIEAEDFNSHGTNVSAANTMPYLGGAYDGLGAIYNVDYNNNDGQHDSTMTPYETAALYRDEATPDLATAGKSVDIVSNGSNRLSVDRPGGATMTVNYRIGWVDNGEWYNYTRTIPAGVYNAYFAMSSGGAGDNMGSSLSIVTSDPGKSNQTTYAIGTARQLDDGAGWGNSLLFPMTNPDGSFTAFRLPGGPVTLRVTTIEGDYDWWVVVPVTATLRPQFGGGPTDSIRRDAALSFNVANLSTSVDPKTVKLTVDNTNVTGVTVTGVTVGSDTNFGTKISYAPSGGALFNPGTHTYTLVFADTGSPAVSQTNSGSFNVNPYPTAGTFAIEAEDFDYNSGQANPLAGKAGYDVNVMPYFGGAYSNLDATLNVDYYNNDNNDSQTYRTNLISKTGHNADMVDNMNARYATDRGLWTMTNNFKIGWTDSADWGNYTRTFPAGTYQPWAALSYGDRSPNSMRGSLQLVTSGAGTTNQTLQQLGIFRGPGAGGWSQNDLLPMTDTNGVWQTVQLGGKQTVRFTMDSGDFDYLILVPSSPTPPGLSISSIVAQGGNVVITWAATATLQSSTDLKSWADLPGKTSPATVAASQKAQFFRLKQ